MSGKKKEKRDGDWSSGAFVGTVLLGVCVCVLPILSLSCRQLYVSAGNPKVYNDGQTRLMMDKLYEEVRSDLPASTIKALKEYLDVQQERWWKNKLIVKPPTTTLTDTEPRDYVFQLETRQRGDYDDSTLSRSFSTSLRDKIKENQDAVSYEMLYMGDARFLDSEKSVYLLRVDLTLLCGYSHWDLLDNWFSPEKEYAMINFEFASPSRSSISDTQMEVYALAPEYSSVVAKESLLSLGVNDLDLHGGGNIKGVDVEGRMNLKRQLQEFYATLAETPTFFSIPRSKDSFERARARNDEIVSVEIQNDKSNPKFFWAPFDFLGIKSSWNWLFNYKRTPTYKYSGIGYSFAFGPQRRLLKRSLLNPRRIFDQPYTLEYLYVPTTSDCYALLVVDKNLPSKEIVLSVTVYRYFDSFCDGFDWGWSCDLVGNYLLKFKESATYSLSANEMSSSPKIINPFVDSTVIAKTETYPLSPATIVTVAGENIPSENIRIINRHKMKVTVPASKLTQAIAKNDVKTTKVETVTLVVATPGVSGEPITAELQLSKVEVKAEKQAVLSYSPNHGRVGETLTIKSADTGKCDLSKVTELRLGNKTITACDKKINPKDKKCGELSFIIPESPSSDIAAELDLTLDVGGKQTVLSPKFKYKAPLTSKISESIKVEPIKVDVNTK